MPGIDLDLELPSAANTMAEFRSMLVTAIEAIAADLEPRIPAGSLYITSDLSMGGAALLNVGGIRLSGGESDEIGTLYMDEELHAVTAAGVVQITDNGALAITALGTIGGDYGGANPAAVTYEDISGEYRFTEAPGTWAHLVADSVVLKGTNGSVRLDCPTTVSGAKTVNFNCFPASGIVGLAYDAATAAYVDASVERETATHLFTSLTATGTGTFNTIKHGDQTLVQTASPLDYGYLSGGAYSQALSSEHAYAELGSGAVVRIAIHGLRAGNRVKSIEIRGAVPTTDPTYLFTHCSGLISSTETNLVYSSASALSTDFKTIKTFTSPPTLGSDSVIWMKITATSLTQLLMFIITYDTP